MEIEARTCVFIGTVVNPACMQQDGICGAAQNDIVACCSATASELVVTGNGHALEDVACRLKEQQAAAAKVLKAAQHNQAVVFQRTMAVCQGGNLDLGQFMGK